jgi:hypothetical protein
MIKSGKYATILLQIIFAGITREAQVGIQLSDPLSYLKRKERNILMHKTSF